MLTLFVISLLPKGLTYLLRRRRPASSDEVTSPPASSPEDLLSSPPGAVFSITAEEYKHHLDLYKFGLEFAFKAITIFFAIIAGILTLILRPSQEMAVPVQAIDDLNNPFKRAFLVTSFLVNIAMILGFDLCTYLWMCLSRQVNRGASWITISRASLQGKSEAGWNELVASLYSPSLTFMLTITTALFIVFAILLGRIMAYHGVWFCDGCNLNFLA
jgi:ABC-type multidrug transport system permease subunit